MNSISPNIFISLLKEKNICIIDIRPASSFKRKHIPGSNNVNELNLIKYPDKYLSKNNTYYILCNKGISSSKVSKHLNSIGFNTISIKGGFSALNFT